MAKNIQEILKKEKYVFPLYLKEELKEFEIELENYKVTKNINGKDYTFYDEESYLKSISALNEKGDVIVTGYEIKYNKIGEPYPICDYPSKYEIIRNKFQQLYKMQSKKEYAIKKSLEGLEDQIKINNETEIL